jgi:hypothetical protein
MEHTWARVFSDAGTLSIIMVFSIPIVAIICGSAMAIVKMVIKHRERMGLIQHGIHPDYPPEEEEKDTPG